MPSRAYAATTSTTTPKPCAARRSWSGPPGSTPTASHHEQVEDGDVERRRHERSGPADHRTDRPVQTTQSCEGSEAYEVGTRRSHETAGPRHTATTPRVGQGEHNGRRTLEVCTRRTGSSAPRRPPAGSRCRAPAEPRPCTPASRRAWRRADGLREVVSPGRGRLWVQWMTP